MSVTLNPPVRVGPNSWRFSWSSDLGAGTTFYVYADGELFASTESLSYTFTVIPGESLLIEVLDDPDALPSPVYDGKVVLQWRRSDSGGAVDYYTVEEYIGSSWVEQARISDDGRTEYFRWQSRFLEDVTVHLFRVTPVGTNGNSGTASSFSILTVRHPDVPAVGYSYSNSTHKVTLTAA